MDENFEYFDVDAFCDNYREEDSASEADDDE